jgi:hypothetical protein
MEMLKGLRMHISVLKYLPLVAIATTVMLMTACDHNPRQWKTPNMTKLTPRLQPMFENTKTVCFGRFMVDVPTTAIIAWGGTDVPLGVTIYSEGVDEVNVLAEKFIDELNSKKAINHDDVPLLLAVENMAEPKGKIVTGYESFQSINGLKINGYFKLNSDGVIIDSRPLRDDRDSTIADIKSIARRLRQRAEIEIPTEPGNCVEKFFLPDALDDEKNHPGEHIRIGFRLKDFPDAHLSISIAPSNPHDPESDSLQRQWKRIKETSTTPEEKKALASIKFYRESARQIHDWKTGYEVLVRNPDEERVHSYHDFQIKFTGVPHDPYKPYADIQFQTGVANNAAGATKASLTDEEAIAVWDKITSTIRVRPTTATPVKSADAGPRLPLGELAATGRTCPQTGWWVPDEESGTKGGGRQHIKKGERMPHVGLQGAPSLWQKLKGEQPVHQTATVWKLVAHGDASPAAPTDIAAANGSANEKNAPERKG